MPVTMPVEKAALFANLPLLRAGLKSLFLNERCVYALTMSAFADEDFEVQ
jgi:hypothetical protein